MAMGLRPHSAQVCKKYNSSFSLRTWVVFLVCLLFVLQPSSYQTNRTFRPHSLQERYHPSFRLSSSQLWCRRQSFHIGVFPVGGDKREPSSHCHHLGFSKGYREASLDAWRLALFLWRKPFLPHLQPHFPIVSIHFDLLAMHCMGL